MKNWITLKEASELSGINYDTILKAHQRKNIHTRDKSGLIEIRVSSMLDYYKESRETFMRNLVDKGYFNYNPESTSSQTYTSSVDPTKVMTRESIIETVMHEFVNASVQEQLIIAEKIQAEFPECKGLSVQNLRRYKSRYQKLGSLGLKRKQRADAGRDHKTKYEEVEKEFNTLFDRYYASQGKGHQNDYEGANIALAYRLALNAMCKKHGKELPAIKDFILQKQIAEEICKVEVPSYYYAYRRAEKNGLIKAARKFRLNRPDYEQRISPLHRWDNWKQYAFMECIQSDGHKFDEKILVLNKKGDIEEKQLYGLVWVESKTNVILRFDLHLRSFNADRVSFSMMNLIDEIGRPDSWRFDNGKEYINRQVMQSCLACYDPDELNAQPRISRAAPYKGRQKSPERIFMAFNQYLKDSKGYSGANRITGPKPNIGTQPVKAIRFIDEMESVVRQITDSINHEWIEVDLDHANISDTDLVGAGMEKPRMSATKKNHIHARRIDLFNAMMKKHHKVVIPKDSLVMKFGARDEHTVTNSGIMKTFVGEKFLYLPALEQADALINYYGRKVQVRYDPTTENSMSKLFVYDADNEHYITTVYCDELQGYTKETGDNYAKFKRKINQLMREFNSEFATIDVLKENIAQHLQNRTELTTEGASNIIKWSPEVSRFSENRDSDEEALHVMAEIRKESVEAEWFYSEDEGGYINPNTGELSIENPIQN